MLEELSCRRPWSTIVNLLNPKPLRLCSRFRGEGAMMMCAGRWSRHDTSFIVAILTRLGAEGHGVQCRPGGFASHSLEGVVIPDIVDMHRVDLKQAVRTV